jgi:hypothetical protein
MAGKRRIIQLKYEGVISTYIAKRPEEESMTGHPVCITRKIPHLRRNQ